MESNEELFINAATDGNLSTIKCLVGSVDLNCKNDNGDSALIAASRKGHFEIVKYLIDKGALIDEQNVEGFNESKPKWLL